MKRNIIRKSKAKMKRKIIRKSEAKKYCSPFVLRELTTYQCNSFSAVQRKTKTKKNNNKNKSKSNKKNNNNNSPPFFVSRHVDIKAAEAFLYLLSHHCCPLHCKAKMKTWVEILQ
jgi:hypothetical protein